MKKRLQITYLCFSIAALFWWIAAIFFVIRGNRPVAIAMFSCALLFTALVIFYRYYIRHTL